MIICFGFNMRIMKVNEEAIKGLIWLCIFKYFLYIKKHPKLFIAKLWSSQGTLSYQHYLVCNKTVDNVRRM